MSAAPRAAAPAAELGTPTSSRRRSRTPGEAIRALAPPYLLLLPTLIVLIGVLAWPLWWLGRISFEFYGLKELIAHRGVWTTTGTSSATASSGASSCGRLSSPR